VGLAVPSYGPARAAAFFNKIECFCFTPQTLAAGESRRMPVLFVLDPAMDRDVHTVTLSYTFFDASTKGQASGSQKGLPRG
jgi:cytochrome c oxidase assembly protein subunit 11